MLKKLLITLLVCCTVTLAVVACGGATAGKGAHNAVHMDSSTFLQPSITIKKGESITLVDDDFLEPHTIANGSWENGIARPASEPGAPQVKNVNIQPNASAGIGPFTSAGTFKLYCTIHKGMNLSVIVQ